MIQSREIKQVREENLLPRQRAFLTKLRQHDKNVAILRSNGKLWFRGPVIGDGPMPEEGSGEGPFPEQAHAPAAGAILFGGREWAGVKRRLSNHYAQLTDEDLAYEPGDEETLFARMARRTFETRENIERFLREECGCAW